MTWDAYHRRDTVLRDVMAYADTRRDGHLPWTEIPGVVEAFGTQDDLLGTLQMRWHTRLSGAVDRELTEQPWDLVQSVVHAWRSASAEMPGVRAILDAHADEPAMRRARRKEWALMASASGLAAMDDPRAAELGRQVEERARAVAVIKQSPSSRSHEGRHGGWLTRLRHVLAA